MQIFVSEFVCGGGWPEERIESSLAREGQAMLLALIEDLCRCPKVRVVTTWDAQLGECPIHSPRCDVQMIESPQQDLEAFRRFVSSSEAVWVIAPETSGELERRQSLALSASIESGGRCRVLGASPRAIGLTADKLRAGLLWSGRGIATPATTMFDPNVDRPEWKFPIVVKPRDGAGSLNTFVIRDVDGWHAMRRQLNELHRHNHRHLDHVDRTPTSDQIGTSDSSDVGVGTAGGEFIQQPFVVGKALSVAMLIDSDGGMLDILPVAEQRLSDDGRCHYLGGCIPANLSEDDARQVADIATRGVRALPGTRDLTGYIGCDVVLPDDPKLPPQLIEINPRLTSSYLGYRQLTDGNIPARLLGMNDEPLVWKKNLRIEFAV